MERKLEIISIVCFGLAFFLNFFKQDLFGLVDGYISHEMKMNHYLLPIHILSSITGIATYYLEFKNSEKNKMNLVLATPGLIIGTLFSIGMLFLFLL